MTHVIDTDFVAQLIKECARDIVLPLYERVLESHEITSKTQPDDLQTIADTLVEERLEQALMEKYPQSVFFGEEGAYVDPTLLDFLKKEDEIIWVADPIDGTSNFANKRRHFAIMLACVIDGKTQYGWIYDVLGNEMTIAKRGQGVYCNGKKLNVAEEKPLEDLEGFISLKYMPQKPVNMRDVIKQQKQHVSRVYTLGSAALEYVNVAKGDADFAVYTKMKPWDHLAGALMVREAGGIVLKADGSPYKPTDRGGGLIVASSRTTWENVVSNFKIQENAKKFKLTL